MNTIIHPNIYNYNFTMQSQDPRISPRVSAGVFSRLFFLWLYPLLWKGSKKSLDEDDIYQTLPDDLSKLLGDRLTSEWRHEMQKLGYPNKSNSMKNSRRPSLLKALTRLFFKDFALAGILLFIEECFAKIAQPLCLGLLLRYLKTKEDMTNTHGYLYAAGVVLCTMYYVASHHPTFFSIYHLNMKVKIACSTLLYRKALNLSELALEETTVGKVVNILSNDVSRLDTSLTYLHYLWIGPIQLGLVIWILSTHFGITSLTGLFFVVMLICQSLMGHYFGKFRLEVAEKTDKRVEVLNEFLNGISVIKMYAWEGPFSKSVSRLREDEIKTIRRTLMLRAINSSLRYVSSKFAVFLILVTYALLGNRLTSEKVFVAVALYQNVRQVMATYLPNGISCLAESLVSIKRIEDFLLLQDYELLSGSPSLKTMDIIKLEQNTISASEVSLQNVVATWTSESNDPTLENITFKVTEGELLVVIGSVGSGKSSLLQVILHELPTSSGVLTVKGSIAYAPQESWIFSGSIRDNIVFNHNYEPLWYQSVLEACALSKDLQQLPYGDKTEVGDKGAILSGGQKARISLARAIYADADIYLLDDPLSAVDAEIGHHLFEKCIRGIIKHKVCILVTHQVQFLSDSMEVLLLSDGRTLAQGNYSTLEKNDVNFCHVLEVLSLNSTTNIEKRCKSILLNEMLRTGSIGSIHSKNDESTDFEDVSIIQEVRSSGTVSIHIYWKYISVGSNFCTIACLLFMSVLTQIVFTGSDYWLQVWIITEESLYKLTSQFQINVANFLDAIFPGLDDKSQFICLYSGLIASLFILTLAKTFEFFRVSIQSSVTIHQQLFDGILRAPMSFFVQNPVGRILNRFTKEIRVIDELLPLTLFDTLELSLELIGVVALISIINPYFLIPSTVIGILFITVRNFYQKSARNLKRLEGVSRSPIYSHLSTSISGLTSIRALKAQEKLTKEFEAHLDHHSATFYLFIASARWLGIVIDWTSIFYTSVVTFGVLLLDLNPATGGVAITSALSLTRLLQWGVRQSADAENQMVSVERVLEYTNIESEAPFESSTDRKPPEDFPSKGEIEMQDIAVQYGRDPPFLKNISFKINSFEKVGIVGRTGSGKSSLISALFRLTEPCNGTVLIDGINVLKIGLHDLRSKMSIIPQDPVLFVGTLRQNLDPSEKYSDAEVWNALKDVNLFEMVKEHGNGLDTMVTEGGSNISVGQRQLICMGRAVLEKNRILILDEATSNIDPETDALIQHTIRTKFVECTVLTIAHRLSTVIDSDRIMVLDAGQLKEFDEPYKLLQNERTLFYHLVQETGTESAAALISDAKFKAETKKLIRNSRADVLIESKQVLK